MRETAEWNRVGTMVHRRPVFSYRCPIPHFANRPLRITENLGEVRQKNDGRWEWFRKKESGSVRWIADWLVTETEQGIAATEEEAKAKVELG